MLSGQSNHDSPRIHPWEKVQKGQVLNRFNGFLELINRKEKRLNVPTFERSNVVTFKNRESPCLPFSLSPCHLFPLSQVSHHQEFGYLRLDRDAGGISKSRITELPDLRICELPDLRITGFPLSRE